jgi:hypothetical protein
MRRVLAVLATCGAAFAVTTAPAGANGPGDPFSTNCDVIAALAQQNPAAALQALAGLLGGTFDLVKIQTHFPPVTFTPTSDGGCDIQVNPNP